MLLYQQAVRTAGLVGEGGAGVSAQVFVENLSTVKVSLI